MQQAEKEKENCSKEREAQRAAKEAERLERERLERLRTGTGGGQYYRNVVPAIGGSSAARDEPPSTPKRTESQPQQSAVGQQASGPSTTFVYVQTPGHSNAAAVAAASRSTAPSTDQPRLQPSRDQTPRRSHAAPEHGKNAGLPQTPHRQQVAGQAQQGSTVQTPLDSLLRAARNMMSDGSPSEADGREHDQNPALGTRRGASEMEGPESPMPAKRRRTAAGSAGTNGASVFRQVASTSARRSAPKLTKEARVPSALDVLADQAQVAAALPDGRASHTQTSNARAEAGRGVEGVELDVWRVEDEEPTTSGRRKSVRGRGSGTGRGRGRGRGRGGKGKGRDLERNEEGPTTARRQSGPGSDGESEIDPMGGDGEEPNPEERFAAVPIPANPPERRKRGRPRKSDQVAAAPGVQVVPTELKEEPGLSTISSGRKRVPPPDRSAVPPAPSTSTVGRRRVARPGSRVGERTSTAKKTGRGASRAKGNTAAMPTALEVPQQEPVLLPTPRIIAPPPAEHPNNGLASRTALSPLDEALAQYEREKVQAHQRSQVTTSSNLSIHAGFEEGSLTARALTEQSATVGGDREDIEMGDGAKDAILPRDAHTASLEQGENRNVTKVGANGAATRADPGHDSELDAEAEADFDEGPDEDADGDEDLDAEGEDEDEREADGATTHVAFSSSDISKLLQGAQIVSGDDDDADAEGEVEDETDQPEAPSTLQAV